MVALASARSGDVLRVEGSDAHQARRCRDDDMFVDLYCFVLRVGRGMMDWTGLELRSELYQIYQIYYTM